MARKKRRKRSNVYESVITRVFLGAWRSGHRAVDVSRRDIEKAAAELDLDPKNVGDLVYTYRYRRQLPREIAEKCPRGHVWLIRGVGAAKYRFVAVTEEYAFVRPRPRLAETRVPDGTPGVIAKYALDDEQALLANFRYNRLIDIFTGVASYSLQNHLRTQIPGIGQIETDEIYVGIDKQGAHYVFPVQAKAGRDTLSVVQIEQDFAMCAKKFPNSICRPIAAQFVSAKKMALFAFSLNSDGEAEILTEKHYILVSPAEITQAELEAYRRLSLQAAAS